ALELSKTRLKNIEIITKKTIVENKPESQTEKTVVKKLKEDSENKKETTKSETIKELKQARKNTADKATKVKKLNSKVKTKAETLQKQNKRLAELEAKKKKLEALNKKNLQEKNKEKIKGKIGQYPEFKKIYDSIIAQNIPELSKKTLNSNHTTWVRDGKILTLIFKNRMQGREFSLQMILPNNVGMKYKDNRHDDMIDISGIFPKDLKYFMTERRKEYDKLEKIYKISYKNEMNPEQSYIFNQLVNIPGFNENSLLVNSLNSKWELKNGIMKKDNIEYKGKQYHIQINKQGKIRGEFDAYTVQTDSDVVRNKAGKEWMNLQDFRIAIEEFHKKKTS
ncbi:hypothetical protein KGV52_01580, partial [Candidatus Gracilibacteria bacterium]|nr:hypothetical protein [Candidatus Gracilibacteria bacterium]